VSSTDHVPSLKTSERIYRALLHFYPVDYRRKYGPLMAQAFRDLFQDVNRAQSKARLARFWVHTLADVATTAAAEHVDILLNGPSAPDVHFPAVELHDVYKGFETRGGKIRMALENINLCVQSGEFVAVVGPTGCGKSTLLGLIAGLDKPSHGQVLVTGKAVHEVSRSVGYIFQKDALFPWKTVLHNVAAGPIFRGMPKEEAILAARNWVRRVGLNGFEDFYPFQLSGGMRKKVALAQSLVISPTVLLMDEPFTDLDAQTRAFMEDELLDVWASTEASVVFVTHDLEEAIALADRVVVLTAGPAAIKGIYPVDIPRPRRVAEVRYHLRFTELHREIWEDLRAEVSKNYERDKHHTQPAQTNRFLRDADRQRARHREI